MNSKIEQIIEEIETYIDGCKYQPLSSTKIIVNKEEMLELLTELRLKTPDEIKRYQKIISNQEAILADAQVRANAMVEEAKKYTTELLSEHQIIQQAVAEAEEIVRVATNRAQEILDSATNDANDIRMGAIQYTDEILKNLENIIGHAMDTTRARTEGLLSSLQGCYDVVSANRSELSPQEEPAEVEALPEVSLDSDMLEE